MKDLTMEDLQAHRDRLRRREERVLNRHLAVDNPTELADRARRISEVTGAFDLLDELEEAMKDSKGEEGEPYPKTVVTVVIDSYENDGAQYTLIYPDGKRVPLGDAEDNYAELAGIIDDEHEKED